MKRIGMAVGIAVVIYALALGVGSVLYATGTIATGATHNDCADFKHEIAKERGIDQADVPQSDIAQRTQECLDGHVLTEREAFRSEYLFWSIWPGAISAVIFLLWPRWTRVLMQQDDFDNAKDASNLEPGN